MGKPMVGKRSGARVILWGRVVFRALDAAIVFPMLFFIVTCVIGASNDAATEDIQLMFRLADASGDWV
jgi:hypothetical protein